MRVRWRFLCVAFPGLLLMAAAGAEEGPWPHPALYGLDWVARELSYTTVAAENGGAEASAELLLVQRELVDLRREVASLRATVDEYLGGLVADLQRENAALRREARARQDGPAVPRPPDLETPEEAGPAEVVEAPATPDPEPTPGPAEAPPYEVVKEWGRTPELAVELGPGVTALKGLVLSIAPGASREALEALGLSLREEFDAYPVLNIDVFDDADAAADFAERPTAKPPRRVLALYRDAASGRDEVLVTADGITMGVPR